MSTRWLWCCAWLTLSCGAPRPTADAGGPFTPVGPEGTCQVVTAQHPLEGATHVAVCSRVTYGTNPPSSGNHYPSWAAFQTYAEPVPPGFLVHDLEHGALVFSYHCDACQTQVAALQSIIDGLPADPLCRAGLKRVVLAPDPALDAGFAIAAWGHTLTAQCVDVAAFTAFAQLHYGQGPEAVCADGIDPLLLARSSAECQWWFAGRDGG